MKIQTFDELLSSDKIILCPPLNNNILYRRSVYDCACHPNLFWLADTMASIENYSLNKTFIFTMLNCIPTAGLHISNTSDDVQAFLLADERICNMFDHITDLFSLREQITSLNNATIPYDTLESIIYEVFKRIYEKKLNYFEVITQIESYLLLCNSITSERAFNFLQFLYSLINCR